MNPLSPLTYHRRHKRRSALLVGLIGLMTAGIYLMIAIFWAMFVESTRTYGMHLSKFNVVYANEEELDPSITAQLRANPDVARVLPAYSSVYLSLSSPFGGDAAELELYGLTETDVPILLEACDVKLKQGHMVQPRTRGLILSEQVAAGAGLKIGDVIHRQIDPERYEHISMPLEVVGILEGDIRLGIFSYEYIDSFELPEGNKGALVIPQAGREESIKDFWEREIPPGLAELYSLDDLRGEIVEVAAQISLVAVPIAVIVALAIALVISAINRIALTQRLPEFGILCASGRSKRWLISRLTTETAVLVGISWALGIGLSWLVLAVVGQTMFVPRGYDFNVFTPAPIAFVVPVPFIVLGLTLWGIIRVLSRLDAVAIVERGALSIEKAQKTASSKHQTSSPKPLASATFYKRHKRRAALLISTMALMIMAVTLAIFYVANDPADPSVVNMTRMSVVSPNLGPALEPNVVTRIKAYPAVERTIPASEIEALHLIIPPDGATDLVTYGVSEEDMAHLVELNGLALKEGRLPQPHTNEMVIPEAFAQNRELHIGDVIGSAGDPVYQYAKVLPAPFVISGILARPATGEENWLSFVSLEFMDSHAAYAGESPVLLVIPKSGQKASLDDWLENEIASEYTSVTTHRQQEAKFADMARAMVRMIAILESTIAIVAAIALAVLNYIFISQRQSEFGVLHALGFNRLQLVWRTLREAVFTTSAAWGISVVLCLIGMLYQFNAFQSRGLSFDLLNPLPWLFTLPIPIAVLVVSTAAVAQKLVKLDPVSIIERR
ncbi:MAG: ABC transporter permease [bacterium]|nr:ABC transporter permease [bacterium]